MTKFTHYDIFTTTSEASLGKICSTFRVSRDKVYITGHPRNDALFGNYRCEYLDSIRDRLAFREVYVYLPTFRDGIKQLDLFSQYHFELGKVKGFLERRNAIFVVKPHASTRKLKMPGAVGNRIYNAADDEIPDIYPLLRVADILITDYSSVYLDYLLLDRPIIFAPFDIDYYLKECRELYYDYDEITPGPKAKDWREVFSLIEQELREDHWKDEREIVCQRFNELRDGKSSARVFKLIRGILG